MKFCRSCGAALAQTAPGAPMMAPVGGAPMMPPPMAPMMPPPMAPMMAPPMMAPTVMPAPAGAVASTAPGLVPPGSGPRLAQGSMITCPRCGTSTPLGFAYCQQCGLHIQPVAPTDPGALMPRSRAPSNAPAIAAAAPLASVGGPLAAPIDPQGATLASDGLRAGTPAPAPVVRPSMNAWGSAVLVNRDGTDGQRFALASEDTVIGRVGAEIAFEDDRFLAREHARIQRAADGTVKVHPIDTLNGVFKKADTAVEITDGMTILVGREVLRFERVTPEERAVHPLVRHGVALFGSPPRDPWGRLLQLIPSGGHRDVRNLATEEVVLGREEGDIVFRDDAFMSRRHAALTWDGKRVQLTDLGSSNGTFVRILTPTTLKHGDHVRMGDQLLRIELGR
jgi:hypothetical protein